MGNPIVEMLTRQQTQSPKGDNSVTDMISQVKNSSDPNSALYALAAKNQNVRTALEYVQQNGGSAKAAFYNLANSKGVNPNDILSVLNK